MRLPFALLLPCLVLLAQETPKAWTPELMMKVRTTTEVQPSPNGKKVAFTVREALLDQTHSQFLTQIYLAESGASRPLTSGESSATVPRWSPDGTRLAFLRSIKGHPQIHVMNLIGGEISILTEEKGTISDLQWSPVGNKIAFVMVDPPKLPSGNYWYGEGEGNPRLYVVSSTLRDSRPEPKCLTPGRIYLRTNYGGFDWAPDGKALAFAAKPSQKAIDDTHGTISTVDLETGVIHPVSPEGTWWGPKWSRDGRNIAAINCPSHEAVTLRLYLLSPGKVLPKPLPLTPDERPRTVLGWASDGRLLFVEDKSTSFAIQAWDPKQNRFSRIDSGGDSKASLSATTMDPSGEWIGMGLESATEAPEAFVTSVAAWAPLRISKMNDGLPMPPLGKMERISWKAPDGLEIEGLLTYPAGWTPGQKVPLLVQAHGGPFNYFSNSFLGSPYGYGLYGHAALASEGFATLRVNVRGSTGRGSSFRTGRNTYFGQDLLDLTTGVDHVIGMGLADPERLGVMGWSYGGYLTARAITETHRFQAASVGAGMAEILSLDHGDEGFSPAWLSEVLGTTPDLNPQAYLDRSPAFHAKGAQTPTLIQHGTGDESVRFFQGIWLYEALERQGCEARLQVFPGMGHRPSNPRELLRILTTNVEWFKSKLISHSTP